jgi:hypothetical protein
VELAAGGGSWSMLSDRNQKENFREIDGEALLQQLRKTPVSSWNYKQQGRVVRHVGPMAQDWAQTFKLNSDSTTINSGDIAGITLAGVQALDTRTTQTVDRVNALETRIRELEQQIAAMLLSVRGALNDRLPHEK